MWMVFKAFKKDRFKLSLRVIKKKKKKKPIVMPFIFLIDFRKPGEKIQDTTPYNPQKLFIMPFCQTGIPGSRECSIPTSFMQKAIKILVSCRIETALFCFVISLMRGNYKISSLKDEIHLLLFQRRQLQGYHWYGFINVNRSNGLTV